MSLTFTLVCLSSNLPSTQLKYFCALGVSSGAHLPLPTNCSRLTSYGRLVASIVYFAPTMVELYSDLKDRPIKETICLFDVDGTLTPARLQASAEMLKLLSEVRHKCAIGFVSILLGYELGATRNCLVQPLHRVILGSHDKVRAPKMPLLTHRSLGRWFRSCKATGTTRHAFSTSHVLV